MTANNKLKERGHLLILHIGFIVMSVLSILVFYNLYKVSRNNIVNIWSNNATEISKDVEYYLTTPKDAVNFTSQKVEEMMQEGKSNAEINQYLIEETSVYSNMIESNTTGIYGFCNGEYLDGSGWIPPEDYQPKERPWYIAAKAAGGKIAFVEPFYNLQTETMMMSVCKLLDDGESVISMDIFMDSIQRIEANMTNGNDIEAAMVIDKSGFVVAHSDANEVGNNYSDDGDADHKELIDRILSSSQKYFPLKLHGKQNLIFCQAITSEWYSVIILNEEDVFKSIRYIYILSAFVLLIVLTLYFAIFVIFLHKQKLVFELQSDIRAIADIYKSMDLLDIKNQTGKNLRESVLHDYFTVEDDSLKNRDEQIVNILAAESSRNLLSQFMDISTLEKRLNGLNSISHEYLDNDNKWNRMQMIVVERANDGSLSKVLTTIQSIDEDKRQQENLKRMAETDALTHIYNRNGGEAHIFEYFEAGRNGMFLLLDVDSFKYVNDTYGHDRGDEVIIAVADCLTSTFRDTDVVYRLGGDEFAVFAVGIETKDTGLLVMNRLFYNIDSIVLDGISDWRVQISVGAVLCNSRDGVDFANTLKLADEAMYESKKVKGNSFTF